MMFCKIMESIINDQMLDYLLRNKLISKHQHGFLADEPHTRSYWNVLMIGHCHLMLVILLIVLMLMLVRHSIPLFIQNCVVSYPPMVFKINC